MNNRKPYIHFVHNTLINPVHPVQVSLIGAGGTGSQVLTALARINQSLLQLQHPGLQVTVYDDDVITAPNLGRMLFAASELGLPKAVALINRVNRFFGTNWKAVKEKVTTNFPMDRDLQRPLTISCTDSAQSRFTIAEMLHINARLHPVVNPPLYWMDFGNGRDTGQVILSTIINIPQPASKKFATVEKLPVITEEFAHLLKSNPEDDLPSCSLADALHKQDLFINSTLAHMGASLLWSMFREGMIQQRGCFLNLRDFQLQPIALK